MGLIQREIEAAGIRTVSLMNLPNIGKIVRPPRMIQVNYSLGTIFGHAGDRETQTKILKKAIETALEGEPESLMVLS
ncbi:MAG: hypothetical protein SCK57_11525 [Bacillota bacterium]|nr:hypothetical protein [Bacillota bacterium]MDW7678281.1 hypothetical protein [Bacillota bacterium]